MRWYSKCKIKALITNNHEWIYTWHSVCSLVISLCFILHELIFSVMYSIRQRPSKLNWDEYGLDLKKYEKFICGFTDRNCEALLILLFMRFFPTVRSFVILSMKNWSFCSIFHLYLLLQNTSYVIQITMHLFIFNGQFDVIFIFGCTCRVKKKYYNICAVLFKM